MGAPGESGIVLKRSLLLGLIAGSFAVASAFAATTIVPNLGRPAQPEIAVAEAPTVPPQVSRLTEADLREDAVTLRLGGAGQPLGSDYLVRLQAGDAVALSWTATAAVSFELHGHAIANNAPGSQLTYFSIGSGMSGNDSLVAPADGFYGFFFQPKTGAAEVTLKLNGFYLPTPGIFAVP